MLIQLFPKFFSKSEELGLMKERIGHNKLILCNLVAKTVQKPPKLIMPKILCDIEVPTKHCYIVQYSVV